MFERLPSVISLGSVLGNMNTLFCLLSFFDMPVKMVTTSYKVCYLIYRSIPSRLAYAQYKEA